MTGTEVQSYFKNTWRDRVQRRLAQLMFRRMVPVNLTRPVLSICFDDFPHSAVSQGLPILQDLGVKGTFYAAGGMAHMPDGVGGAGFILDDLQRLLANDQEIGCHTFSHLDCGKAHPDVLIAELDKNATFLHHHGVETINSFAYPFGNLCPRGKRITNQRFTSARGVHGKDIVRGKVDLGYLPAIGLECWRDPEAYWQPLRSGGDVPGWLILYTHDVRDDPADWGITPGILRQVLETALSLGYEIVPVGEMVARLARPNA